MDSIPLSVELPIEFHTTTDATLFYALNRNQENDDTQLISHLEDVVSKYTRALAFYKGQLNSRRRNINTILPWEILSNVFYHVARSFFRTWKRTQGHFRWLGLAHVCRYWRSILLRSPHVFSFVGFPVRNQQCLQTCLKYSSDVPLYVRYDDEGFLYGPGSTNQWPIFLPHLSHTRSLSIAQSIPDIQSIPTCTMLTALKMRNAPMQLMLTRSDLDKLFSIFPNILELDSDTRTIGFDWTNGTFPFPPNLISLSLGHTHEHNHSTPILDLVTTIRRMASLRKLRLTGLSSYTSKYASSPECCVFHIQPLQWVHLAGEIQSCASILSVVELAQELVLHTTPGLITEVMSGPNSLITSLAAFFERIALSRHSPYTIYLDVAQNNHTDIEIIVRARPTKDGSMVPYSKLPRTHDYHFQFDILVAVKPFIEGANPRDALIPQVLTFYYNILRFIPNIDALVVLLDRSWSVMQHPWSGIGSELDGIQSLQVIVNGSGSFSEGDLFVVFPNQLCKERTDGGIRFPFLKTLSVTVAEAFLQQINTDIFIEILHIALGERARRGFYCETLILRLPWEKNRIKKDFGRFAKELVIEDL